MQIAFKEWALVVDALGRGEQIIILRKGGIHERTFKPEHSQFLLFPTNFHSEAAAFVPQAQERLLALQSKLVAGKIPIQFFATVVEAHKLHSLEQALKLKGQHIWSDSVIADRFDWGKERSIYALAVRVYALPDARIIDLLPEYGGCKSWIELKENFNSEVASPVLSDAAFNEKLKSFRKSLVPPLVLASASPRRSELLREAGFDFEVHTSSAEELHDHNIPAGRLCELNAELKAQPVSARYPDHLVLGADTLVTRNGTHFGKPKDLAEAKSMLMELQGKTHQVITGVCLCQQSSGRKILFHDVTEVTFKPLNEVQIEAYLEKVHVLDKAGAYAIQEYGEMIIENISGSYSNVVGLPVERLLQEII